MRIKLKSALPTPDILAVLEEIQGLKEKGIISDFVLCGSIAVHILAEPRETKDIDIFVLVGNPLEKQEIKEGIFNTLLQKGELFENEHIKLYEIPVHFLFPSDELEKEAFQNSTVQDLGGLSIKVVAPEYLVVTYLNAIASNPKRRFNDSAKIDSVLTYGNIDIPKLKTILNRFNLTENFLRLGFSFSQSREVTIIQNKGYQEKEDYHTRRANDPLGEKIKTINHLFSIGKQIRLLKEKG